MTNEELILNTLQSMQGDIKAMQSDIMSMQGDIMSMQGDMKSMQGDMKSMRTEMAEQEDRLTAKMAEQEDRILTYVNVMYENLIEPKFKLLTNGHQALMEKLAPVNRVDELEEDVKLLKVAFRQMSAELEQLKCAQ